jgi:hypothetical protein
VPQFQINREDFTFIKYNEEIYTYFFKETNRNRMGTNFLLQLYNAITAAAVRLHLMAMIK